MYIVLHTVLQTHHCKLLCTLYYILNYTLYCTQHCTLYCIEYYNQHGTLHYTLKQGAGVFPPMHLLRG